MKTSIDINEAKNAWARIEKEIAQLEHIDLEVEPGYKAPVLVTVHDRVHTVRDAMQALDDGSFYDDTWIDTIYIPRELGGILNAVYERGYTQEALEGWRGSESDEIRQLGHKFKAMLSKAISADERKSLLHDVHSLRELRKRVEGVCCENERLHLYGAWVSDDAMRVIENLKAYIIRTFK